ncbi:MAG: amino acid ABC transporter permease [Lachnospiraceae bacterium]|nr:amino acid ABC transporter permease [Lachnospiraceae bacterium]MDY5742283.1 amino acid ABC transporter permease [Lachnospiraceae bacterium]
MDFLTMLTTMLGGIKITLLVFTVTAVCALPLGLLVCSGRISKWPVLRAVIDVYILIMRGTPLLLQLIFIYYGLPNWGITLDRLPAALITFVINYAAYFAEIFRGGFVSIDPGQYEAGQVLGLSRSQTFYRVILPQLIKRIMPPIGNELITLVKDTSLVYILALGDVLRIAKTTAGSMVSQLPYLAAALIYLGLIIVLTVILKQTEKRYSYYEG